MKPPTSSDSRESTLYFLGLLPSWMNSSQTNCGHRACRACVSQNQLVKVAGQSSSFALPEEFRRNTEKSFFFHVPITIFLIFHVFYLQSSCFLIFPYSNIFQSPFSSQILIFPYKAILWRCVPLQALYMVGTSNQSVPEMAIEYL